MLPTIGYIIHQQPFSESSLLLSLFTRDFGMVRAIARGARRPRRVAHGNYSAFTLLQFDWYGKGDLLRLKSCELVECAPWLAGDYLYSAHYANELLYRLIQPMLVQAQVFSAYQRALAELASGQELEVSLRRFELSLLHNLGYGPGWFEADSGAELRLGLHYRFAYQRGFVVGSAGASGVWPAETLLQVRDFDFAALETRQVAKQLCRQLISYLLNGKQLQSRSYFTRPVPDSRSV